MSSLALSQRLPDKPTRARALLVAAASAFAAATVALGCSGKRGGAVHHRIPDPDEPQRPLGITLGPDGALWFTEFNGNKIGRIRTDGVMTTSIRCLSPLPASTSSPPARTQCLLTV